MLTHSEGSLKILSRFVAIFSILISTSGFSIKPAHNNTFNIDVWGYRSQHRSVPAETEKTVIDKSGSGRLTVEGRTNDLYTGVSGSGPVDLRKLVAKTAYLDISGSASVDIFASEKIVIDYSGFGRVRCHGPAKTEIRGDHQGRVNC